MKVCTYFPFEPKFTQISRLFPKKNWEDCGKYWLNISVQGSENWLKERQGQIPIEYLSVECKNRASKNNEQYINARVTGSNFGAASGWSRFTTPEELAQYISGRKKRTFSPESIENMAHGTKYEPVARTWYENATGLKVEEVGLAVPKWNFHLGASVDGVIVGQEGILEIKCPKRMYGPLIEHTYNLGVGWEAPSPYYHEHIWDSHYAQMQGGMAILGKKWCDYLVYCTEDRRVFRERILFDRSYWEKKLYPSLQSFLHNHLFPILEETIDSK